MSRGVDFAALASPVGGLACGEFREALDGIARHEP
ncbi:hypothetical protein sphantq_01670 [Sphingobium sp. AntQ-1]|nr:hypothetical protein sphantq_01670 [Sphingobium sp. AntQ-1]